MKRIDYAYSKIRESNLNTYPPLSGALDSRVHLTHTKFFDPGVFFTWGIMNVRLRRKLIWLWGFVSIQWFAWLFSLLHITRKTTELLVLFQSQSLLQNPLHKVDATRPEGLLGLLHKAVVSDALILLFPAPRLFAYLVAVIYRAVVCGILLVVYYYTGELSDFYY